MTDTPIVDQNAVMQYVLDTCAENDWNIECLCFDPANASKLMMDLSNEVIQWRKFSRAINT